MDAWYLVRTSVGAEERVLKALAALGCESWAAKAVEWRPPTGKERKRHERFAWPKFVFVRLEKSPGEGPVPRVFGRVLQVDGATGFFGRDRPIAIIDEGVEALKHYEEDGHLDKTFRGTPKPYRDEDLPFLRELWANGSKLVEP